MQQLALLADVHGDVAALDAVIADVERCAPHARLVCAGDLFGYGAAPEACLLRLLEHDAVLVRGNHEELVLGQAAARARLHPRALAVLLRLPPVAEVGGGVVVCHGDLDDADARVDDAVRAEHALLRLRVLYPGSSTLVCGHTHQRLCFSSVRGLLSCAAGAEIDLEGDLLCLINPGAVSPDAAWALLDLGHRHVRFYGAHASVAGSRKMEYCG